VTIVDSLHPQVHDPKELPVVPQGAVLLKYDIRDADALGDIAQDEFDVVVHLAAETGTGQSLDESVRHTSVNVVGTATLLDAFTRTGRLPSHIIVPSSRAVYGEGEWSVPGGVQSVSAGRPRLPSELAKANWLPDGVITGSIPVASAAHRTAPAPSNVYGATKLAQEHVLHTWCAAKGVALTVFRLQNVYGPGQAVRNPYTGVMTLFARRALDGQPIPVYEDGAIVRDFVFVDDVVDAILAGIDVPSETTRRFDIGSGRPTTILEMAEIVATEAGGPRPVVTGDYRLGDVRAAFCETSAAEAALSWRPQVDLRSGVRQLLDWVGQEHAAA
jgi:dTDP-L-rhamnose 4-epimerase